MVSIWLSHSLLLPLFAPFLSSSGTKGTWFSVSKYCLCFLCSNFRTNNLSQISIFQKSSIFPHGDLFFFPLFLFQTWSHSFIILKKPLCCDSQKGELISTSSAKFSAGADGSLYVSSPGGEESGEYVCTATNAAGYAKRKVQLTVYGESPRRSVFLWHVCRCQNSHFSPKSY